MAASILLQVSPSPRPQLALGQECTMITSGRPLPPHTPLCGSDGGDDASALGTAVVTAVGVMRLGPRDYEAFALSAFDPASGVCAVVACQSSNQCQCVPLTGFANVLCCD